MRATARRRGDALTSAWAWASEPAMRCETPVSARRWPQSGCGAETMCCARSARACERVLGEQRVARRAQHQVRLPQEVEDRDRRAAGRSSRSRARRRGARRRRRAGRRLRRRGAARRRSSGSRRGEQPGLRAGKDAERDAGGGRGVEAAECPSAGRARAARRRPAGSSRVPVRCRSSSRVPARRSIRCRRRVSAGWVVCSARAAAEIEPWSATAISASRSRGSCMEQGCRGASTFTTSVVQPDARVGRSCRIGMAGRCGRGDAGRRCACDRSPGRPRSCSRSGSPGSASRRSRWRCCSRRARRRAATPRPERSARRTRSPSPGFQLGWGRRADRGGAARVIRLTALAHGVALALFAALAHAGRSRALIPAAALAGACFPPVATVSRAAWREVEGEDARRALFALDGVTTGADADRRAAARDRARRDPRAPRPRSRSWARWSLPPRWLPARRCSPAGRGAVGRRGASPAPGGRWRGRGAPRARRTPAWRPRRGAACSAGARAARGAAARSPARPRRAPRRHRRDGGGDRCHHRGQRRVRRGCFAAGQGCR